jgi:hypothetical protein
MGGSGSCKASVAPESRASSVLPENSDLALDQAQTPDVWDVPTPRDGHEKAPLFTSGASQFSFKKEVAPQSLRFCELSLGTEIGPPGPYSCSRGSRNR